MENVNFFIVFIEGILSIFSPCILPILPIYLSMLSNSSVQDMRESNFRNSVLLKNTIFFTLGISSTFFILDSSIKALSTFLNANRNIIMIIGGILIIIMGLFYLGIIKSQLLSREKRFNVKSKNMSPVSAFVLGFTFSFGWTPCIGPILASVLVMASSSDSVLGANLLILVYTIGFILPFIIAALFYSKLYKKFDKLKNYMEVIKKISGIIIIISGIIMLVSGAVNINKISSNKNMGSSQNKTNTTNSKENANEKQEENIDQAKKEESQKKLEPIDFTLYDQYGNKHTLSEYKGKTVFLNFWATWCPPCRAEMPHIEELYNEYNKNADDVVILGIATPNLGREGSVDDIKDFLNKEGFTFPVVFDENAAQAFGYGISSLPSTFIINKEGYITKYVPGGMSKETMKNLIENP